MRGAGCGGRVRCSMRGLDDRAQRLKKRGAFLFSPHADDDAVRGRPKLHGPASIHFGRARGRMSSPTRAAFVGPRQPYAGHARDGAPLQVHAEQAVPTIACGTPEIRRVRGDYARVLQHFAREAADALASGVPRALFGRDANGVDPKRVWNGATSGAPAPLTTGRMTHESCPRGFKNARTRKPRGALSKNKCRKRRSGLSQSTSSVHTLKLTSVFGPKVCVIGTSEASRPCAISTRPMRGTLLRGSNMCHRPPM